MKGLCIKTHKSKGEKVRRKLHINNALDHNREIVSEGDYLYIPVKNDFTEERIEDFKNFEVRLLQFDTPERAKKKRSFRDLINDEIRGAERNTLPRAFDIIGHIAIIKIPEELQMIKFEIGRTILEANKNISTVYESSGVAEQYRVQRLELIAGEDNSITELVEYGITMEVDVKQVYFSPRLATERNRIANSVLEGEYILDMFAGVGPFSIMIVKTAKPAKIFAVDINPQAIYYLKRNINNNSADEVIAVEGDAKECVPEMDYYGMFDRIIMNLPHSSWGYLPLAIDSIKKGGIIHFYEILYNNNIENRKNEIIKLGSDKNLKIEIETIRKVHPYSPSDSLMVFDIRVHEN